MTLRYSQLLSLLLTTALSVPAQYQLQTVVSGLSQPLGVAHAGDARLFIVERAGRIKVHHPDGRTEIFLDITDRVLSANGEQGLLGLAFPPDHAATGRFYVYYTRGSGNGVLRVSRFVVGTDPNVGLPGSEEVLWEQPKPDVNHNGGCLRFGPDGHLYLAPGDGGGGGDPQNNAQHMGIALGKMLRLDVSGPTGYTVPPSNPFVGQPGVLPEIWASGLRNPWRFSFDRQTGDLWIADVGQEQQEEIDRWPAGDHSGPNFGWRCYEGLAPYNTAGCLPAGNYVAPVHVHQHADGSCSISGGAVYRGTAFPALQGRYIYSDLCHGRVHALNVSDLSVGTLLSTGAGGTVSVDEDAAGELYFVRMNAGVVQRLIDASATVQLRPRVALGGAMAPDGLMRDDLRGRSWFPTTDPYPELGMPQVSLGCTGSIAPEVLAAQGPDAVVDWVRVELRSAAHPHIVLASRAGLLQRDGDVVAPDGSATLTFAIGPGAHHVAVRHRNHLGVMTAQPVTFGGEPVSVDFTSATTHTWGMDTRQEVGGIRVLRPGDVTGDGVVAYTGTANDRDPLLLAVGGSVPTNTVEGYLRADVDLDGTVKYTGAGNDRDVILQAIGGAVPTHSWTAQIP